MALRRYKKNKSTIADAISAACGDIISLAEEIREVVDNASGTSRENTSRIQTLDETASQLEGIEEPTVEDDIGKIEIEYLEVIPRNRRQGLSRADRRDNAVSIFEAVIEDLNEKISDNENDQRQELVDELENINSELEGCEFPGMYG